MKTITIPFNVKNEKQTISRQDIINFYEEATEDYSFWSQDLNMHFGYYDFFRTNIFRRDTMLNEMNLHIYNRLQLGKDQNIVTDLGCGMGATMRHFLNRNEHLSMIGVTLSPFQVREGNKLLQDKNGVIFRENYCETSIASESMDGVVGIESLCHSGHSKESLREGYRLLKPGGKMVISDAFLKKEPSKLSIGSSYSYKRICEGWNLDGLGVISEVKQRLLAIGFKKITIEDISFRIAPSVLHVPFAILGFLLKNIWQGKTIKRQSWNNLKASFFALLCGLHRRDFGYYIITATK